VISATDKKTGGKLGEKKKRKSGGQCYSLKAEERKAGKYDQDGVEKKQTKQ